MKNKNKISKIIIGNKKTNILLNLYLFLLLLNLNLNSEITLTINGNGTQQILNNRTNMYGQFKSIPDEIYVNNIYQNKIDFYVYNLVNEINNVTMVWNSQLENCNCMFMYLDNIIRIDFSKFDTSKVTQMYSMFQGCTSITSIDFTNFYTPLVTGMSYMFFRCNSLKSLDLRTFNTSKIVDMQNMFYECSSLKYLDVSSFNTSLVNNMANMFHYCRAITSLDLSNFDTSSVTTFSFMFSYCQSLKTIKFNFNTLNATNMVNMFSGCSSLIYLDLRSFETKSVDNAEGMFANIRGNMTYCYNQSLKQSDPFFLSIDRNMIFNCSSECFSSEKFNLILEKNKCVIKCSSDDTYIFEYNGICYEKCPNSTNSINQKKLCCLDSQPYSTIESYQCYEECIISDFFNEKCEVNSDENTLLNDNIIYIQNKLLNEESNNILIEHLINNTSDLILKKDNILYQLTTSYNQRINTNENEVKSTINMENCERHLRNYYNFENPLEFIIFKIEYHEEGLLIPIIEYEIYDIENNTKLNLGICEENNITLNILVDINESISYKYNPFCDYYNDRCNKNTSDYGTDIIINDRRNEFITNKMSLCEKNCIFKEYNSLTKRVTCECKPKSNLRYLPEIKSETNILYNSFDEIKEITNLQVFTCYHVLFSKNGLLYNIGSYILIFIMLIYLVSLNIFITNGYNKLFEHIKNFVSQKLAIKSKKENNNKNKLLYDINIKHTDNTSIKNKRKNVESNNDNVSLSKSEVQNMNMHSNQNKSNKDSNTIINEKFNDYELNTMSFDDALKFDKRTYMQYYFSLLRTKHYILFSFVPLEDYNAMIIKIFLFFLSFVLYYDLNTLLFIPLLIHKICLVHSPRYYLYQIGNIIISNIICYILDKLIKCVSMSQENILELKSINTTFNNIHHKYLKTVKCLIIKYTLFFILSFLFLLLSWYYIAIFCAVYANSQLILLINTLISFGLSLIYPLILNLIPGLLRIEAIQSGKKEKESKYNVSKILQSI